MPLFDKIVVHEKIELIITEGQEQQVTIETGKNLFPDIEINVIDNELILVNNNSCNFFRDYGLTKVYVTSPNINTIRNASEFNVTSNGVLTYPSLYLMSVGNKKLFLALGDFNLDIENESVTIWSNGFANFYLNGTTNNLNLSFYNYDMGF